MAGLTINGNQIEAPEGAMVLELCRQQGIDIPTLCYHPGLPIHGSCRLCTVQVTERGRTRLTASCCLPAADGMEIETHSERVTKGRRVVAELLLKRCPDNQPMREMAQKLGVEVERVAAEAVRPEDGSQNDCILCALCVRACAAIGAHAISMMDRGPQMLVGTAFERMSDACIGCASCAEVCPTGAIKVKEQSEQRSILLQGREISKLQLMPCSLCFTLFATDKTLEYLAKHGPGDMGINVEKHLCPECARLEMAARALGGPPTA